MNQQSKRYYKDIKAIITSRGTQEKRLIKDYKLRILELNETKPDISYEELKEILGSPIDIITEYYEGADTEYIMKQLRITNAIRLSICCILVFTLIGFAISVGVNIKLYQEIHSTIVIQKDTTIQ